MSEKEFIRLYWCMRLGVGFIWIWTAFVSWFAYPHEDSIALLKRTGIATHADLVLAASCLLDLGMGIASLFYARAHIWWTQFALVTAYSVIISLCLPEFLFHPYGPITKNLSVLACLAALALTDKKKPAVWRA